ncbi:MAG: hypothetical protein KAS57_03880 [Gammaproteobacteria bacterium]|nr:hypothetical protein [Gammaproteobacteria bacterium]
MNKNYLKEYARHTVGLCGKLKCSLDMKPKNWPEPLKQHRRLLPGGAFCLVESTARVAFVGLLQKSNDLFSALEINGEDIIQSEWRRMSANEWVCLESEITPLSRFE